MTMTNFVQFSVVVGFVEFEDKKNVLQAKGQCPKRIQSSLSKRLKMIHLMKVEVDVT